MFFKNRPARFSFCNWIIFFAVLIIAMISCPGEIVGQENLIFVGISFPLDNNANINFHKIRPWVHASITEFQPTQVNKFRINEAHHLYLGAMLYGVGHLTKSRTLKVVGGVLVIDDALQHTLRIETPVHSISNALSKHRWYQSLTTKADSFFGK